MSSENEDREKAQNPLLYWDNRYVRDAGDNMEHDDNHLWGAVGRYTGTVDSQPSHPPLAPTSLAELGWTVDEVADSAHNVHHREPEPERGHQLWWARLPRSALILGSTQPEELVDRAALEADDVEITRRRSGGGIVYLDPDTDCWIDAIVPTDSPLWDDDIGRAFHWLGRAWEQVLNESLPQARSHVSTETPTSQPPGAATQVPTSNPISAPIGRAERTRPFWCFSEVGHGEVVLDGFKVVGLSQRRTRHWIRLQGLVLGSWPAARLERYISGSISSSRSGPVSRFVDRDPFAVDAGPPPGQKLPDPDQLARQFFERFS